MKYSLYDELLEDNNILSHVFLECIGKKFSVEIANESADMSQDEIKNRKIDIELKIHGREVDPHKFFTSLYDQYEDMVKKEAGNLIKEQTTKKLRNMIDMLYHYERIIDSWADEIDWRFDNPLLKDNMKK